MVANLALQTRDSSRPFRNNRAAKRRTRRRAHERQVFTLLYGFPDPVREARTPRSHQASYDATMALLDQRNRLTAILAVSDQIAIGAIDATRDRLSVAPRTEARRWPAPDRRWGRRVATYRPADQSRRARPDQCTDQHAGAPQRGAAPAIDVIAFATVVQTIEQSVCSTRADAENVMEPVVHRRTPVVIRYVASNRLRRLVNMVTVVQSGLPEDDFGQRRHRSTTTS